MIPRANERPGVIALKSGLDGQYEEGRAVGTTDADLPLPGMLLELVPGEDGVPTYPPGVRPLTAAATVKVGIRVAVEERLSAPVSTQSMGRNRNTRYVAEDIVPYIEALPGDVFQLRVPEGEDYVLHDMLQSAGDGTLEPVASGIPIAEVEEDIDLSDTDADENGVGGFTLVRCRIL